MVKVREMANFYDDWLDKWDQAEAERAVARRNMHEEDLDWVETRQDHRAALVISPETGFRTYGTTTMVAEIPPGSHTGAHKHGEEAIFIVEGEGFSVIDGVRYDWRRHSCLLVPFGSVHQHFNTGQSPARYVSALAVHLEHLCGMHRTIQVEDKGITMNIPEVPISLDGMNPDATGRVALFIEDAIVEQGEDDGVPMMPDSMPDFDPEHPLVLGDTYDMLNTIPAGMHKSKTYNFMRIGKEYNDFKPQEVEVSGLLIDPPHEYGGLHAHAEAHLYVIQGSGYTTIGDEQVPWKMGTGFQVPGPQTPHRHVNTSDGEAIMIRIAFGVRYFIERSARREWPYLYLAPRQGMLEQSANSSAAD